MADSTGAAQDGATATVDRDGSVPKARFDGLMSSHQKALAENATLKARLAGFAGQGQGSEAQDGGSAAGQDSQQTEPEHEDGGMYEFRDGQFVPFEPPTPMGHSELVSRGASREPTVSELQAQLDRQVGKPSRSREWPDVTAR